MLLQIRIHGCRAPHAWVGDIASKLSQMTLVTRNLVKFWLSSQSSGHVRESFGSLSRRVFELGPRDNPVLFRRDRSRLTYYIYLCLTCALLTENGKFLLPAKTKRQTTYTEYVISVDSKNISRSSNRYVGKMRKCQILSWFWVTRQTTSGDDGAGSVPTYDGCYSSSVMEAGGVPKLTASGGSLLLSPGHGTWLRWPFMTES